MSYTLLAEAFPVARKEHRCIWCGQKILIGEKYCDRRGAFDGSIQRDRFHLECEKSSSEYFRSGEDEFDPYENERPTTPPAKPE